MLSKSSLKLCMLSQTGPGNRQVFLFNEKIAYSQSVFSNKYARIEKAECCQSTSYKMILCSLGDACDN